ncbi:MAG: hypothetical protein NVS1B13_24690 [Flavisolibacter sp.]
MKFNYNDGGRSAAGFKGNAGDCVTRAIAIVTGMPYKDIYEILSKGNAEQRKSKYDKKSKAGVRTASRGINVNRKWFRDLMKSFGLKWQPTMFVGQGCKVHLNANELPKGKLIVSVSKHWVAVIDGVIQDTYNPSERGSTIYPPLYPKDQLPKGAVLMDNGYYSYSPERCVYGYYHF